MAEVDAIFGLNLREEPSADSEALAYLPNGTVVILLDGRETNSQATWQQVAADGLVGWVVAEFLQPLEP